jgi:poly(A) polymerase
VTDVPPERLAALFDRVEPRHGRYPVTLLHWQGRVFELTQLPAGAADPVAQDALTRDFRLNSIYYDLATGRLADPVGGLADIGARIIRPIHAELATIERDPLTMLRAVRIGQRLGFAIAPALREAMMAHAATIATVTVDRLLVELYRQLTGGHAQASMLALRELGILATLWPALDALYDDVRAGAYVDFVLGCIDTNARAGTALSFAAIVSCLLWGHCLGATLPSHANARAAALALQPDRLDLLARYGAGMRRVWAAQFGQRPESSGHANELDVATRNLRLLRQAFHARAAA